MSTEAVPGRIDWIRREARFNSEVSLVRVDAADGRIGDVKPGDPGYLQGALSP